MDVGILFYLQLFCKSEIISKCKVKNVFPIKTWMCEKLENIFINRSIFSLIVNNANMQIRT
jgi:hypothetical protein